MLLSINRVLICTSAFFPNIPCSCKKCNDRRRDTCQCDTCKCNFTPVPLDVCSENSDKSTEYEANKYIYRKFDVPDKRYDRLEPIDEEPTGHLNLTEANFSEKFASDALSLINTQPHYDQRFNPGSTGIDETNSVNTTSEFRPDGGWTSNYVKGFKA